MIIGLGNDIVDISRVDEKLQRRILTEEERKNKGGKITKEYVAGRFALKESYFKALLRGLSGNSFQDISFLNRPDGSLYAMHHRYKPSRNGLYNYIHASLSHDSFAFATVVLEKLHGKVFLGIGTNLGNREENIQKTIEKLSEISKVLSVSSIIETEAYGKTDQPSFLNCVVEIESNFAPDELLNELLRIEREMGRVRIEKWGPRIIDLDILFYGNLVIKSDVLTVPHYDFENRIFFVKPMYELAPNFVHPVSLKTVREILDELENKASKSKS
ncbi:2-amino-4-hydroxy-6-hydroxymethyldihydropteridine diphosphokinase [Fervidobacterium islandicum]|uniref:2-amino-4-hydroxy-6- hydroxymethyldihydropteridine diphosphokinase n=1 Tax=Fervidobacterium islandicum TaxID=2423 RepID=UPI003A7211A5